jgi:hypothetical protein
MALLAWQQIKITGLNPSFTAASTSDTVVPDERLFLVWLNTDAATRTISLVTPAKFDQFGQPFPDVTVTIAATTGMEQLPVPPEFADPTTGLATITISPSAANVTVGAFRI